MDSLDRLVKNVSENEDVKKAISGCIVMNMSTELAVNLIAQNLIDEIYDFIDCSDELSLDDGSNVRRDFEKTIKNTLMKYLS